MQFPVFPLNGAILFPKTNLPLNIFEERYIDMVNYALSNNRFIGMIQSKENNEFFSIGCLGKITNFTESQDGRYQINLEGLNRFKINRVVKNDYKFVTVDGEHLNYNSNFKKKTNSLGQELFSNFKKYLTIKNIISPPSSPFT